MQVTDLSSGLLERSTQWWQHLVRVKNVVRVELGLDALHHIDHLRRLGHVQEGGLHYADAVLGRDRTSALGDPLEDIGLDRLGHRRRLLKDPRRVDVEVQVAVAEVAKAAHQRSEGLEASAHHLDQVVQLYERDGDVVLVHGATLRESLGDPLANLPDVLRLRRVLRDGPVDDGTALHDVLEKGGELLRVVLFVGARELDEHVVPAS
mmetsp:Transcript_33080/g.70677  ORF Transcript_33080/g.70677 Transcript_33080/m.70677 type:complete len:207 (+) Transcript_33080:463-1083(+)